MIRQLAQAASLVSYGNRFLRYGYEYVWRRHMIFQWVDSMQFELLDRRWNWCKRRVVARSPVEWFTWLRAAWPNPTLQLDASSTVDRWSVLVIDSGSTRQRWHARSRLVPDLSGDCRIWRVEYRGSTYGAAALPGIDAAEAAANLWTILDVTAEFARANNLASTVSGHITEADAWRNLRLVIDIDSARNALAHESQEELGFGLPVAQESSFLGVAKTFSRGGGETCLSDAFVFSMPVDNIVSVSTEEVAEARAFSLDQLRSAIARRTGLVGSDGREHPFADNFNPVVMLFLARENGGA